MTNFDNEYLGPFIYNSTIVCVNASHLMSYNYANFSPSSSLPGKKIAPNIFNINNNISLSRSISWWSHPVSSRHEGWHGTCWVLLEHVIQCHDHNCDPREYCCPLHCYKYKLDIEWIWHSSVTRERATEKTASERVSESLDKKRAKKRA